MNIIGIITTRDRPQMFLKAIETAVTQTRKLDELIVVSDSGNENYERESIICKNNNAILLKNAYAHNYAGSLNTAIHYIISRSLFKAHDFSVIYTAFMDDDDSWHADYVEKCEKSLTHKEDFVISGINYYNEDGVNALSIPQEVVIEDFLKGNPHIQGSNTFIKLAALLKAGMFDENMPSTTDRDLFVRVMLLNPAYAVINEWLVDINAYDDPTRITKSKDRKAEGLRKFYYKYGGLMSKEIQQSFFERAQRLFQISRSEIEKTNSKVIPINKNLHNTKKYSGQLTVGFIATEYELGLRLLKQLLALKRRKTKIVILINFINPIDEYENILKQSRYSYELITCNRLLKDIENSSLAGLVTENQINKIPIYDIAVSRSLLQFYLYLCTEDGDTVWVVDDDMELYDLNKTKNDISKEPVDIDGTIEKYRNDYDAVVGNYALDAPLPALSILRTSLIDYCFSKINAVNNADFMRLNEDYYYDLTEENNVHLETPLKISNDISLDFILSGKAASRPLYNEHNEIREVKSRGGNTFIFNRELLRIPNWSLQVGDKTGRRSDYFWALQAKKQGYKLANIPFTILHNRNKNVFDYKKEENKFLLDLIGASFTKAIEAVTIEAKKSAFFPAYKNAFVSRLTKFTASYYRIMGLLQIISNNQYINEFTASRLSEFIKNAENYIRYETIINAFESLRKKIFVQKQLQTRAVIEKELKTIFRCKTLQLLGSGREGIVFTDKKMVYKWFYKKPDNWDFMKQVQFAGCAQMYEIELIEHNDRYIIRYTYSSSAEYNGGYARQLADLIAFGKQNGFVFTNIKKRNFIISNDQLKMIDYGHSIEPYSEEKYLRSVKRGYEMLRYSFLNEEEFGNLITMHYIGNKAQAIDCGWENFENLVQKRHKETMHDNLVKKLLYSAVKLNILDYGAGKCKIANSLTCNNEVTVFDINKETLHKRAGNEVRICENIEMLASDSYDIVLNNLVLCCTVDDEANNKIISDITRLLKIGGRAIISVCSPFFNDIQRSEIRIAGNHEQYQYAGVFDLQSIYDNKIRQEYHRPVEYYENLLRRYGLEIKSVIECNGVDTETILPIAEHIIFDCILSKKDSIIADCTLLVKTNPMEHGSIYSSIKHIVGQLEKGMRFFERVITVDASVKEDRARRYADDNAEILFSELNRAKSNGLIDRILIADGTPEKLYMKYFGLEAANQHALNGQGLYAALAGFDEIKTQIVFQTDSDILYTNTNPNDFLNALQKARNAATVSLSIAHNEDMQEVYGERTEVRSSFINLKRLNELLPLPNSVVNNTLQLPWHRALDKQIASKPCESVRLHSKNLFFIHPQNSQKTIANFISYARQGAEKNILPESQYNSVDLKGSPEEWLHSVNAPVVLYIRGFNTPPSKIKRLFDTLKRQTFQDYFIVYVEDASQSRSADYARFVLEYDLMFKDKNYFISNDTNIKELANFVMVMQNIALDPQTIVINIDNDDCLVTDRAIERIVEEFNNGADITCGNCLRKEKPLKEYTIYSFDNLWDRNGDNVWLHPKCFKRKLFDYIDIENDLKIDGQFVDVNTDFAFMLPMINYSVKSVFIKDIIYYFEPSIDNQKSIGKYSHEYKEKIRSMLLEKAKRNYEKNCSNNR